MKQIVTSFKGLLGMCLVLAGCEGTVSMTSGTNRIGSSPAVSKDANSISEPGEENAQVNGSLPTASPTESAGVNSANPTPEPSVAGHANIDSPATLSLDCRAITQSQTKPIEVNRSDSLLEKTLKLSGDFCLNSAESLNVVFVVDVSGSMGPYTGHKGSDPMVNGSCGRLKAAKAISDYIATIKKSGDQVNVGIVQFSTQIVASKMEGFDSFTKNTLNSSNFCIFNGGTNYYAGFSGAKALLQANPGQRNIVYFISDGVPTSDRNCAGGNRHTDPLAKSDGLEAASSLRNTIKNITIRGLLLGSEGAEAKQILIDSTGSADNVRLASDASQLAGEIMKFNEIELVSLSAEMLTAASPKPLSSPIAVTSFVKSDADKDKWKYVLADTNLNEASAGDGLRTIKITAKDKDNFEYTTNIVVNLLTKK